MQTDAYTDGMRLVDAALQRDHDATLEAWLRARLDRGDSYEDIARGLTNAVGVNGYSISFMTAKRWCLRLGLVEEPAS